MSVHPSKSLFTYIVDAVSYIKGYLNEAVLQKMNGNVKIHKHTHTSCQVKNRHEYCNYTTMP